MVYFFVGIVYIDSFKRIYEREGVLKLSTLKNSGEERCYVYTAGGFVPVSDVNREQGTDFPTDLLSLLQSGRLDELKKAWTDVEKNGIERFSNSRISEKDAQFAPLYRRPRKIWGIGLNYRDHAADLSEKAPTAEPASFMKPDTAIIGFGDTIKIPKLSERTTGEAELGLIFGKTCRDVARKEWESVLAGYTTVIDMTAEDILRRNPRNLTQCKSFDTFFSFGPVFYTTDEIENVFELKVRTMINGTLHAENVVSNMTFPPDYLVSYHSRIMTMLPGDIISSGTPGAVPLKDGDTVECRVDGFHPLVNPVADLKV